MKMDRIAEKRKKKRSFDTKLALVTTLTFVWVISVFSYYHVATTQQMQISNRKYGFQKNTMHSQHENRIQTRIGDERLGKTSEQSGIDKLRVSQHITMQSSNFTANITYPPIEKFITGEWNVTGDVNFLVDFAIVGFPKCGTSTMMEYLDLSPYTKVAQKERCELGYAQAAPLIRKLYDELPPGNYKRGIKCPRDAENDFAMKNYKTYLPKTDFLIGVRHPVRWFESFYNFRLYNNNPMPPPEELIGACTKYSRNVCTHRARFHQFLANLGKTPLTNDEKKLFKLGGKELRLNPLRGKVFLYHVEQLKDDHPLRTKVLREDLSDFLDLPETLPPMHVWNKPGKNLTKEQLDFANARRLDICHSNHTGLRQYLVKQAINSVKWISDYFLKSEDVYVSSPSYFASLLNEWCIDPCNQENQ
mmetsp:Transcript_25922/g.39230  ORF Transcript_25922/g.39230 Transcript_25922/m.39230 type:complete len:418 (+) Transcript_25922:156-1409(+)